MAEYPLRLMWETEPWVDFTDLAAWSLSAEPSNPLSHSALSAPTGNGLILTSTAANKTNLTQILRDPRLTHRISWARMIGTAAGPAAALTGFTGEDRPAGLIPENQGWYQISFDYGSGNTLTADCAFVIGIENCEVQVYSSVNGTSWNQVTLSSIHPDRDLLQKRHWSRNMGQKMLFFTERSARWWRVAMKKKSGYPFLGLLSNIYLGRHYAFEGPMAGRGDVRLIADGQAQGGSWESEFRSSPVFRSLPVAISKGSFNDLEQMAAAFYRKAHGDPVMANYYHAANPDFHTIYGIIATGARFEPHVIDSQVDMSFVINEITRGRAISDSYYYRGS